ncbi:MAG TPA: energy transducer TonB, partial [Oleiagrimonas sp.]|nr:energy transducer TonB [Oleiagrimonas sp.]
MRIAAVFGLVLMVAMPSCALAQNAIRQYPTTIQLDIDAHGKVTRVGTPDSLPEVLVAPVRQTVADWRFKPPEIDGHPVSARTWAYVTVQVVKRPDSGYGVRVIYRD